MKCPPVSLLAIAAFIPCWFPRSARVTPLAFSPDQQAELSRREALRVAIGGGATASAALLSNSEPSRAIPSLDGYRPGEAVTAASAGRSYFPPLTPPIFDRATYRYDLGRDSWALEQLLAFANVTATVRTIVVRMRNNSDGDLWVNGPQWPTGEYCRLLDELGTVRHVMLPCNALEHKAPMAAFLRRYPHASVWIAPGQYGPFGSCGTAVDDGRCRMGYRVDGVFPVGAAVGGYGGGGDGDNAPTPPPWLDEFDMRTLYVDLPGNAGPVSETAFYHRPSRSLITTDSVIFVPDDPPPIFGSYFDRGTMDDPSFWPRTVLQAVFLPPRRRLDGETADERWPGYGALRGRLVRAPILRAFADARAPGKVGDWVRSITSMGDFDRVLTSHFASPVAATPDDFASAFRYLDGGGGGGGGGGPPIACGDWELLDSLNAFIERNGLGAPVVFDFTVGCIPESR